MKKSIKTSWPRLLSKEVFITLGLLNQKRYLSIDDVQKDNLKAIATLKEGFNWIEYYNKTLYLTPIGRYMCEYIYFEKTD